MVYDNSCYPHSNGFLDNIGNLILETLNILLENILKKKKFNLNDHKKTFTAIVHCIVSAVKPRSFHSPLQLSIASFIFNKLVQKI